MAQKKGRQEGDVREEDVHGTEVQKQEDWDHGSRIFFYFFYFNIHNGTLHYGE